MPEDENLFTESLMPGGRLAKGIFCNMASSSIGSFFNAKSRESAKYLNRERPSNIWGASSGFSWGKAAKAEGDIIASIRKHNINFEIILLVLPANTNFLKKGFPIL